MLNRTLVRAGLKWPQVDHILLAGESIKIPLVGDFLKALSGQPQQLVTLDPEAASNGAALFAMSQIEPDCLKTLRLTVHDRLPRYYGVLAGKGKRRQLKVAISANLELPCARHVTFRTSEPNQTAVVMRVVDGCGDPQAGRFHPVGNYRIVNLPPGLPVGTPIEVEFVVSKSGKACRHILHRQQRGNDQHWCSNEIRA